MTDYEERNSWKMQNHENDEPNREARNKSCKQRHLQKKVASIVKKKKEKRTLQNDARIKTCIDSLFDNEAYSRLHFLRAISHSLDTVSYTHLTLPTNREV